MSEVNEAILSTLMLHPHQCDCGEECVVDLALRRIALAGRLEALRAADAVWREYLCACAGKVLCRWHDELDKAERAWKEEA